MASDGSELGTLVKLDPWEPLKLSIAKKILSNWITENMSPWAKSNPYSKLVRSLVSNFWHKMMNFQKSAKIDDCSNFAILDIIFGQNLKNHQIQIFWLNFEN